MHASSPSIQCKVSLTDPQSAGFIVMFIKVCRCSMSGKCWNVLVVAGFLNFIFGLSVKIRWLFNVFWTCLPAHIKAEIVNVRYAMTLSVGEANVSLVLVVFYFLFFPLNCAQEIAFFEWQCHRETDSRSQNLPLSEPVLPHTPRG